MSKSAATAAGLLASSCFRGSPPVPRPTFAGTDVTKLDTRWPIKRVVYLMLENRSFDTMFGRFPGANGTTVGNKWGQEVRLSRTPEWLPGDLPHDRAAGLNSLNRGQMDGFALGEFGDLYAYSQFHEQDIPNYFHWAREHVLCDNFFASILGPSYPNHLFFIAGQAGGAIDNPENIQVRRENDRNFKSWGCDAYGDDVFVFVEDENGQVTKHSTCFNFETVGEQLSARDIDWAYYSSRPDRPGYIWQAYSAIRNVYGTELWDEHIWDVDDLLMDIEAAALPPVTWVTPQWELSDHPPMSTIHAYNWVTDIVNAIMRSSMWEHTALFITWDEWGGLYDHVLPPVKPPATGGDRRVWEWGIRVPTLVISPYTRRGYVDDAEAEFSAPLRFVADNWDLPYLTRAIRESHNFEHVFDFTQRPRPPDPRPKKQGYNRNPLNFPENYPKWPEGIEPAPPDFAI